MSHHADSGSGDYRHDHGGAERHHHHHHHGHAGHEQGQEGRHPSPHVEARTGGSPQEVAGYLDELADAIRAGGITIRFGERAVGLRLNGEVALDLRATGGNGGTSRLDLSLSWQAPQPPTPPAPKLRISPLQSPEPGGAPGEGGQEQQSDGAPMGSPEGQF